MAKTNNLTDFLTGIADKIRGILGATDTINPQDFEDKIDAVYQAGAWTLANTSSALVSGNTTITFSNVIAEPKMFSVMRDTTTVNTSGVKSYIVSIIKNGSGAIANIVTYGNGSARVSGDSTTFSYTYDASAKTLTITTTKTIYFFSDANYTLYYAY